MVRDLLFEPISLDDWLAPGPRAWEAAPPQLAPASAQLCPCRAAGPPALLHGYDAIRIKLCLSHAPPNPPSLPPSLSAPFAAARDTRYVAHAGILEATRGTFLDIQEHGILHRTLLAPGAPCAGYRLVVTGHSLGAGVAFLLALYLRQFFPDLR